MDRALKGKEPMLSQREPPKRCPRCDSTNTKFCYFNNYSQSQPRHFCRACRRYWTEGGTLRNVPQGGGSHRRAKRPRTQASASGPRPKALSTAPSSVPPLLPPSPMTSFSVGGDGSGEGGMPGSGNFQTFHPGNNSATAMMADFMGFQACYDQACFNPTALPMLPGFLNMPSYPQMPPPLPFDPNLVIASHQQMNITVFTSTTTMTTAAATTVSAAAAGDINIGGDLGFWNNNDFNIQGDDQEGSSPPPPPPPQNPSDST